MYKTFMIIKTSKLEIFHKRCLQSHDISLLQEAKKALNNNKCGTERLQIVNSCDSYKIR